MNCENCIDPDKRIIQFFVIGIPRPGGSKRAFRNKYSGKINTVEAGKYTAEWRQDVRATAMQAMAGKEPLRGALRCDMTFIMPRPKYHFNKKGLKPNAEYFHSKKPDKLKLARSTQDALTGIVWEDDSQDAIGEVKKIYGTPTGCKITITEIKERSDEK